MNVSVSRRARDSRVVIVDTGCVFADAKWVRFRDLLDATRRDLSPRASLDWPEIADAGVLLLGARTADGHPAEMAIARLRRNCPHVPVFVLVTTGLTPHPHSVSLMRAGADAILGDSLEDVIDACAARAAAPVPEHAIRALHGTWVDATATGIALYCLRNGNEQLRVHEVAHAFGHRVRSLRALMRRAEMPSLHALVRAGTLFHAAELLRRARSDGERKGASTRIGGASAATRMALMRLRRTLTRGHAVRADELRALVEQALARHGTGRPRLGGAGNVHA